MKRKRQLSEFKDVIVKYGMTDDELKSARLRLGEKQVQEVYSWLYKQYHITEKRIQDNLFTTIKE